MNARFEKGAPRISGKHKLRRRQGDSAKSQNPPHFKALLNILPLEERGAQALRHWHIVQDALLGLDQERDNFFSCLAISAPKLDQLIEAARGLEEGVGQVKCEGRAVALLSAKWWERQPLDKTG